MQDLGEGGGLCTLAIEQGNSWVFFWILHPLGHARCIRPCCDSPISLKEKSRQLSKTPSSEDGGAPGHVSCSNAPISSPAMSLHQPCQALAAAFAPAKRPTLWVKDHVFETRRQDWQVPVSALPAATLGKSQELPASAAGINFLRPSTEGTQTHQGFSKTLACREKPSRSSAAHFFTSRGSPLPS